MLVDNTKVFVVHGRNRVARRELFAFLRAIGLSPMSWNEAVIDTKRGAPFIGEVVEIALSRVQAVVVLLTGDDVGRPRTEAFLEEDTEEEKYLWPQARLNVLFEAGMAFSLLPSRTILVELGHRRSCMSMLGRTSIKLSNRLEHRWEFAMSLHSIGCNVDLSDVERIRKVGNFGIEQ